MPTIPAMTIGYEGMSSECVELKMTTLLSPSSLELLSVWNQIDGQPKLPFLC